MESNDLHVFVPIGCVSGYDENDTLMFKNISKENSLVIEKLPNYFIPKLAPITLIQTAKINRVEATYRAILFLKINPNKKPYLIFIADNLSKFTFNDCYDIFINKNGTLLYRRKDTTEVTYEYPFLSKFQDKIEETEEKHKAGFYIEECIKYIFYYIDGTMQTSFIRNLQIRYATCIIQTWYRMICCYRSYRQLLYFRDITAIRIQSLIRGFLSRRYVRNYKDYFYGNAIKIQSLFRRYKYRKYYSFYFILFIDYISKYIPYISVN